MTPLMKHLQRKQALRLAIDALPDAWITHDPSAALGICDQIAAALAAPPAGSGAGGDAHPGAIAAVKDAVECALAGLPDYVLCSRYPDSVGIAVRALLGIEEN